MPLAEIFQIITLVTGVIYVILEILQKNFMWILGVITSLGSVAVFLIGKDVPSAILYTYYLVISFVGLYQWRAYKKVAGGKSGDSGKVSDDVIVMNRLTKKDVTLAVALLVAGCVLFPEILDACNLWKGGFNAYLEVFIVVLSAVATYWLTKAFIEQWLLWILANGLYVWFCVSEQMWWMAAMYVVYVASAVYGYIHWKRHGVICSI